MSKIAILTSAKIPPTKPYNNLKSRSFYQKIRLFSPDEKKRKIIYRGHWSCTGIHYDRSG